MRYFTPLSKNPHEFAKCWQRDRNQIGAVQHPNRGRILSWIVQQNRAKKDIAVGRDIHRLPAQASSVIFLISSRDRTGPFGSYNDPKKSLRSLFGPSAAANSSLPSGKNSMATLSPESSLRCYRTSSGSMSCPSTTVRIVISKPPAPRIYYGPGLTFNLKQTRTRWRPGPHARPVRGSRRKARGRSRIRLLTGRAFSPAVPQARRPRPTPAACRPRCRA
jgi:hypothetical protein